MSGDTPYTHELCQVADVALQATLRLEGNQVYPL